MKLKTRKSLAKRVKFSGTKANRWGKSRKIIRRSAGQDHFNAREAGRTTLKKRRQHQVTGLDKKNIARLLPYS